MECYKCSKFGNKKPDCWELKRNSHKRPRNGVCVANVEVSAQKASNSKERGITAQKGSMIRINA